MLSSYGNGARSHALAGRSRATATRTEIDALVAPAKAGNVRAISLLVAAIQPVVMRYCRGRIGRYERSYASADDVAQEVCIAVLSALPAYRDRGRPFLAFVYGIASHKVADAHRCAARNRAEPVAEFPDVPELADGPEQHAVKGELAQRMDKLMEQLPPKQRDILTLRIVIGLSADETAEAVGSTPGAVRVAQHRALAKLRKVLEAEGIS
jgi:RNA polymerase sigma-70 factor (ECF subfamily)